ncbi:MAG: flagellar basal body rod protein FlgC [Lachnospiraceae bacterium]|nr:flagellar basal body rod protein FlgC [Lachnospiraceae bacterium]
MGVFSSMNVAATGMTAQQLRMDVISENIANASTTRTQKGGAYRRKTVVFSEQDTTSFDHILNGYLGYYKPNGVKVTQVVEDPSDLRLVYEPDNPDANEEGYVEYPNVDTVTEMTNLIDSSRAYEANVTAFNAAKSIASKGLELFKG